MDRIFWTHVVRSLVLLLVLGLTFSASPPASSAGTAFERTYGGDSWDFGACVRQTSDQGYIIVGETQSFGANQTDVYLIKTDSLGDTVWERLYDVHDDESGSFVQQTPDGGYIIAGRAGSWSGPDTQVYLIKTNPVGDIQWERMYGGAGFDAAYCVDQTSDGGYIIAGWTESFGAGGLDVYLIKTDSLGNTEWESTYGGPSGESGSYVRQTPDGGYIVAGYTSSFGAGRTDVYLVKTDAAGNAVWENTYGDTLDDFGFCVEQTDNGCYTVSGYTYSFGAGSADVLLLKTDSLGGLLWHKTYGGKESDGGPSFQRTADGGYIIGGMTWSFGAGHYDVYLIKTDSVGNSLWERTYGSTAPDEGRCVRQTSDGGYVIVGQTDSYGHGRGDVYLIKTDENGDVGVAEEGSGLVREHSLFKLGKNRPDPFSRSTVISYSLLSDGHVRLEVIDAAGRVVEKLVDRFMASGVYYATWYAKDRPNGVYFYRLQAGNFTDTKKMILLR